MRQDRRTVKVWGLAALLLVGPGRGAIAQDPLPLPEPGLLPSPAAVATPTLAAALAEARPLTSGLALTVGGDKVTRLPDAVLPGVQPSVAEVADEYGRMTQRFGGVTAVAPPSMTVLQTGGGAPPDPFDGMPPEDALKLLLGGLDDRQWALLTGDTGLGAADLRDDQRPLFPAIFPADSTQVFPTQGGGPAATLTPNDWLQARLRLGQRVQIDLPVAGRANSFVGVTPPPPPGKPQYKLWTGSAPRRRDTLYGLRLRAVVANALKPSDLDFRADPWKTPVDPSGAQTVGELIARIGAAAKTELYADRRYEGRSLTVLGHGPVAAGDLLRALSLCVCGAYRQMGPAFVLSNDREGLAARRALLNRIPQQAALLRAGALADAGDRLFTLRGGRDGLPSRDGTPVTDAQKALVPPSERMWFPINGMSLRLTWAQLTPPQQDLAQREADLYRSQVGNNAPLSVTLAGEFNLSPRPVLEALLPAAPGPVEMEGNWNFSLFQPSDAARQAYLTRAEKALPVVIAPAPAPESVPPLPALLARFGRRAVLARPQSAADVDTLLADMKRLGFNQLWLDVFSNGKPHLGEGDGVLTAALAKTKGTGILVIPTLSLLTWGTDAPADTADRTLLGETSAQAQVRQNHDANIRSGKTPAEGDKLPPPTTLSVCPASPSVQETLVALVQKLAATPGVAALALRDTVTPGYENDAGSSGADDLGYATPLRLAFLRRWHVDPTDTLNAAQPFFGPDRSDTSVPEFEDAAPAAGPDLTRAWNDFRRAADLDLMQRLLAAAQTRAGQRLPLLVRERGAHWTQDWYGLWADPRAPLPAMTQAAIFNPPGNDNFAPLAHTQSRVAVYALPIWYGQSRDGLAHTLLTLKPGWDGLVLDAGDRPGGEAIHGLLDPPTGKH